MFNVTETVEYVRRDHDVLRRERSWTDAKGTIQDVSYVVRRHTANADIWLQHFKSFDDAVIYARKNTP